MRSPDCLTAPCCTPICARPLPRRGATAPLAFLLLDLDRFKEVNDTFGHHYGDVLLEQVSGRLTGTLRTDDLVARLGGDEFAVLLPDTDHESAARVIGTLCAALDAPFIIDGQVIHVGASTGLALYPAHGEDVDTLPRGADIATYTAKRGRENHAVYTPVGGLREAIASGMLLLPGA